MDAQKRGDLAHGIAGLFDELASMSDLLRPK
jgi:hypothetical protein